jgi:ABC-type polysaccharide/polyol phosphate transport system ATPase subunit
MIELSADNVRVEFPVYDGRRSLRHTLVIDRLLKSGRRDPTRAVGGRIVHGDKGGVSINALDDLTFSIREGDRIGLVGHNGAGKSTLLKVMAGIYEPVSGTMTIRGQVMPLFNLSLGTDMDTTGFEAVRIRGMLMGMTPDELNSRMDDIAEFTELGEYLNMPMRTYSTGMLTRLLFAVATSVRPEILLMDEFIGAGDAAFVEQARTRMQSFLSSAGIVVVASHSDHILQQWCNKAMLLHQGRLIEFDETSKVLAAYHKLIQV